MLTHLDIRNIVLIDALALDFEGGLSALTGETGAGKSILLDALGLVRGDRADASLVRKGADQAQVSAAFDVPADHPVWALLSDQGIMAQAGQELILRRALTPDGKSRAFINDQVASVALLKTVAQMLVDLHGQFETGSLFDPAYHRRLVDRFGNLEDRRLSVATAWQGLVRARTNLENALTQADQARRDEAYIRDSIDVLQALGPEAGEEARLVERKNFLSARAQVGESLNAALSDLAGESGAESALSRTARNIDRLRGKLPGGAEAWLSQIDGALSAVRDVTTAIDRLLFDQGEGSETLEQVEDRLYDLRAAARRFSCGVDELPDTLEHFQSQLGMIAQGADALADFAADAQRAETAYLQAAGELSAARVRAAKKLDAAVMKELPPLKLERAIFKTEITPLSPDRYGPDGIDAVRFTAAMNPGVPPGPIDKVASGGELSRLMLALKVAVRDPGHVCMIFDEVDSGLGGAVADAMGERLARLARSAQVLVVTHAPQVAARADHHFVVSKETKAGKTTTSVMVLGCAQDRCEEIARMLSGACVTDEARAAAQRLLNVRAA